MRYPVVLHAGDGVRFGVIVPDLPGCFSSGETFDQALDCVVEAIELPLEGLVEAGGEVPAPRSIAEHRSNPDFAAGVWATVAVDASRFDGLAGTATLAPVPPPHRHQRRSLQASRGNRPNMCRLNRAWV